MPTIVSEYSRNNIRRITYDDGTFEDVHNHPLEDRFINDLTILQPLILRPQSFSVEVTITYSGDFGTSGAPNIEYSTDDWATSTQTHLADFTLTSIGVGTHTLKVRDVANPTREAVVVFEMPNPSGYVPRWRGEFQEVQKTTTSANWYRVDVLEKDYSGSVTEICMGAAPVILNWDSSDDDLFFPVRGSSAALTLMAETDMQFLDLATADDRQFLVKIYRGVEASPSTLVWQGYVITDDYEEPYRAAPYEVQLLAVDGLGLLKNEKFESRTGERFNRTAYNLREFLHYTIGRLGFHNPWLGEYLPLIPEGTSTTDPFAPIALESLHINCAAFYDSDGTPWNIYDVLVAVLEPLGLRMFYAPMPGFTSSFGGGAQYGVYWLIYTRRFTGSVSVAFDNVNFTPTTYRFPIDFRETMATPPNAINTFHWVFSDQTLRIIPGAQTTGARLTPITKDELHPVPTFNAAAFDANGVPIGWEGSSLFTWEEGQYIDDDGITQSGFKYEKFTGTITGDDAYNQYIKHLPKPVTLNTSDTYKVSIDMEVQITVDPADTPTEGNPESISIYWVLAIGDQILNNDGTWETLNIDDNTGLDNQDFAIFSADLSSFTAEQTALIQTHKFQLTSEALPVNANMINKTANLRIHLQTNMKPEYLIKSMAVRLLPQGEAVLEAKEDITTNTDFRKGTQVRELQVGQFDAIENPADLIQSTFTDSSGASILNWEIAGQTGTNELLDVLAQRVTDQHAANRRKIEGSAWGAMSIPNQFDIDGTPYLVQSMSYDLKAGIARAKFIEINTASGWPAGGSAPGGE